VVVQVPVPFAEHVTPTEPTVDGTVSAIVAVPGPEPVLVTVIVYVIGCPTMYDVESAIFVCVNTGLAAALMVGVDAEPPPHCVEQPGVVGVTVAVLATAPAGRFTEPATAFPDEPVVVQVPPAVAEHVTPTDPTVVGTVSAIDAVPGPVPLLVTVIV
jgi:hypothetical protein